MKRSQTRLVAPLMNAFRASHAAHDAKVRTEQRDAEGNLVVAGRRGRQRAVTERLLRQEVSIDLGMLMNTIALSATVDLGPTPAVARSILNYGLPDIGASAMDEGTAEIVRKQIVAALVLFEPRILAESIQVMHDTDIPQTELKLRFMIRAELLCNPAPVPVEFVADLELGTGTVSVGRL